MLGAAGRNRRVKQFVGKNHFTSLLTFSPINFYDIDFIMTQRPYKPFRDRVGYFFLKFVLFSFDSNTCKQFALGTGDRKIGRTTEALMLPVSLAAAAATTTDKGGSPVRPCQG